MFRLCLSTMLVAVFGLPAFAAPDDDLPPPAKLAIEFERDIRPILARSCYRCHGAKAQKGGLRLHDRTSALAGGDDGPILEVGKSASSRIVRYVAALDDDHMMPPDGDPLSAQEIGLLRAWIDQGAKWPQDSAVAAKPLSDHWAFQPPIREPVPSVRETAWPRNAIDLFVLAGLEKEGLNHSPETDRVTLIRRVNLDLIGLPPTIAEVDNFLADHSSTAYDDVVDRLLASPHYGERWGRRWLDRARYADTNGYEKDRERSVWPYRDWVIRALNADMPFDQFTIEQIAGDLLPNATVDQKVATGFHRNTMINEEGGIDVEEFRFASLVDRVATTGTVWLGMTIQCAQCHSHKYDPISQREYYQFLAFLNNADEPDLDIPDPTILARRQELEAEARRLESDLENQFPADDPAWTWTPFDVAKAVSNKGATLSVQKDRSVLASGDSPESDEFRLEVANGPSSFSAIRIEALTDPSLPKTGPGRTPHGNFVLTEVKLLRESQEVSTPIELSRASADFSQPHFDASGVIDGKPSTGWAIDDGSGHLNKNRSLVLELKEPLRLESQERLAMVLEQNHGSRHTLGRFRISAGEPAKPPDPRLTVTERRQARLSAAMDAWEATIRPVDWTVVAPVKVTSKKNATMEMLSDRSVLVSGDKPNNDVYAVELPLEGRRVTALRLEVLPDPSLPDGGPGRAPLFSVGDFILTEFEAGLVPRDGKDVHRLTLQSASQDFSEPGKSAALAIDGIPDTGWTIKGGVGRPHAAVFELREPLASDATGRLVITLHQFGIHQMTIGRFRLSVTSDALPVRASGLAAEIEEILQVAKDQRTATKKQQLKIYFLSIAPELAAPNARIAELRRQLPKLPTSMVMEERSTPHARRTFLHKRGEFLKTTIAVAPAVPAVLHPLPDEAPRNRLTLAQWLVDRRNPLVGRVVMNQIWQAYFGRGLVTTVEDFGTRGDKPTHPELLDWLSNELIDRSWSLKAMHRLIVTSATYRQSSIGRPEDVARDPRNELLSRASRLRVDAEVVRDIALGASGLLNHEIGGPSVFPPQPDGATSLAYGMTPWPTSKGRERYRRGLYTYLKRTAPYAAFLTFDAPTSDTTCVRRERSNTPLQALTMLNDTVIVEASQALARRIVSECPSSPSEQARFAFRLCMSRLPKDDEAASLVTFFELELARFRNGDESSSKVAGTVGVSTDQTPVLAAWTTVARAILNLDETITRE
jgi:hypothetical protein